MASNDRRSPPRLLLASFPTVVACALAASAVGLGSGACGPPFTAAPPGATTSSSGGGGCPDAQVACDAQCVDLMSNADHCGECGFACDEVNGKRACNEGVCADGCPADRADCDKDPDNGCEVDIATDLKNCGRCERACATRCAEGECVPVVQISAGTDYTCAVLADGTAYCWGRNPWGNLGDGTMQQDRRQPTQVVELDDVVSIAASTSSGRTHTCAVLASGNVACWGAGNNGQLGYGGVEGSPKPVQAEELTDVKKVVVGSAHTCAVTVSSNPIKKELWCWGQGGYGQLGYGGVQDLRTPRLVIDRVEAASAGATHTCAARSDGGMVCWGGNLSGQLGTGTLQEANTPAPVSGILGVREVAAGPYHTCATTSANKTFCWGKGDDYRLGLGTQNPVESSPRELVGLLDVVDLSLGSKHSGAVLMNGTLAVWGNNSDGQLGNSTQDPAFTPQTLDLMDIDAVALGDNHTCALTRAGQVLCWGANDHGQLGDGTIVSRSYPRPVVWPNAP